MPWTVADVDRFKKGLTAIQKRKWVEIANSALASCIAKGKEESKCEGAAIRQANGAVLQGNLQSYSFTVNTYEIRREVHQGKTHIIVPVIMLKDGVHNGSRGPLLHLSDEYGRVPDAWNGIPITLSHPKDSRGNLIPANSPQVIDTVAVGRVYNTKANGMLRAEAWIEENKCQEVSPEALQSINERKPINVSVGVFSDEEETPGNWNGEAYIAIARNHRPDHLALLIDEVGACSLEDGCGIRANQAGGGEKVNNIQINALKYSGTETVSWSKPTLSDFGFEGNWASLSQPERSKVASHYLIGSASAESFADLKLPVVNPKTGKLNENALRAVVGGRGAQVGGVTAEERSAARRRAYRLLNSEFNADLTIPENLSAYAQGFKEICNAIRSKLDAMDTDTAIYYFEDAFNDGTFIYEIRGGSNPGYFRRSYQINNDGSIEFTGEPEKGVVVTKEYTPIQGNTQTKGGLNTMSNKKSCCPEKVNLIIQSEFTRFDESDREYLEGLEETMLIKHLPIQQEPKTDPLQVNKDQIAEVVKEQFKTTEQFLSLAPSEIRDQLQYGLTQYQTDRKALVDKIVANSEFEEKDLEGKGIVDLRKMASLVKEPADYTANNAGSRSRADSQDVPVLAPIGVKDDTQKK